jgi:uncharacterized integral membrane protein
MISNIFKRLQKVKPQTIVAICIGVLLTILVIQNFHAVVFNIFFWHPEIPLIILVLILLIAGFIAGWVASSVTKSESKKKDEY